MSHHVTPRHTMILHVTGPRLLPRGQQPWAPGAGQHQPRGRGPLQVQGGLRSGPDQDLQHPPGRDRAPGEAEDLRRQREGGQTEAGALQAGGDHHHLLRGQSS